MSNIDYPADNLIAFRKAWYHSDMEAMRRFAAEEPDLFRKLREQNERVVCDAGKRSSPDIIRLLIELGADINEQDSNRGTGLEWAVNYGRCDAADTFLELGADPNLGCPIFSVACSQHLTDRIAMAMRLLDHGADINQPFLVEGLPPRNVLSEAIDRGHAELAEFLKSQGAKLPEKPRHIKKPPPPEPGDYTADLVAHFRKHYGKPEKRVWRDIVPASIYPIAVHYIPLTAEGNSSALFTTGLSRVELKVPQGAEHWKRAELVLDLDKNWPRPDEILKDPRWAWPVQWMRKIAIYAAGTGQWLGAGLTTFAAEDPPKPLAPGLGFTAWLLSDDTIVRCKDGATIQTRRMFPLYNEEYVYAREHGSEALFSLFAQHDEIEAYIDVKRPNVAIK